MARTFGAEIETIGLSLENVARAVGSVVGGTVIRRTDPDDAVSVFWSADATDGRAWRVEDDDSLQVPADQRAELVTPTLDEADLDLLIRVIDAVRGAGATVNSHCGVHVHVAAAACSAELLDRVIDLLEPTVIEPMQARDKSFGLHSHAFRGTVEFRYFSGTVDPQKVAEYVRLCLGVAEQASIPVPSQEDR